MLVGFLFNFVLSMVYEFVLNVYISYHMNILYLLLHLSFKRPSMLFTVSW